MQNGPRRRALSEADRTEWAAFAQRVRPLPGHRLPEAAPAAAIIPGQAPSQEVAAAPAQPRAGTILPLAVGQEPAGLDRASWGRLRAGKLVPARKLDLHGRTAQAAYAALHHFLASAHADRVRCVEIITGRGSGEAGGVLRRELPLWLNAPALRPLLLAATHPHPANPGAVRLLLRRPR